MKSKKTARKQPKSFSTRLTPADAVSLISAMLAFLSVIVIFRAGNYYIAAALLVICAVIDFFDGKIARRLGHANEFGKNIDSLSDMICFGVAPALFMQQFLSGYLTFIPCIIILAGIYRLARFNISSGKEFVGMPITANGFIIPALYVLNLFTAPVLVVASIVISLLMVSTVRIRKVI